MPEKSKTTPKKTTQKTAPKKGGVYIEGIGRKKTAVARARLVPGKGTVTVLCSQDSHKETKTLDEYFGIARLRDTVLAPFERLGLSGKFDVTLRLRGGGPNAQAEAARLGIARAIVKDTPEYKKQLRGFGFLTRDPRMVERKKYGLKKARRAPQWSKR